MRVEGCQPMIANRVDALIFVMMILAGVIWLTGCGTLEPYGQGREIGAVYHFAAVDDAPVDLSEPPRGWGQLDSRHHLIRNALRYLLAGAAVVGGDYVTDGDILGIWDDEDITLFQAAPIDAQRGEETIEASGGAVVELRDVTTCPDHIRAIGPGTKVICDERE